VGRLSPESTLFDERPSHFFRAQLGRMVIIRVAFHDSRACPGTCGACHPSVVSRSPGTPTAALALSQVTGDALHQAGQLIRAEVALAKSEVRQEIRAAERGALILAVGLVLLQSGVLVLAQALILKLGATTVVVAVTGSIFTVAAGLCIGMGAVILGRRHLVRTRARLEQDAHTLLDKSHE
jgi:hypothetical protein